MKESVHSAHLLLNRAKANHHPKAEFLLFKNYSLFLLILSSKTSMRCSKKCAENKCICFDEIIWLIIMKMRLKRKNGLELGQGVDTNI